LAAATAKLHLHLGQFTDRPAGMAAAVFNFAEQEGHVMENGMTQISMASVVG
jgi:hypothetical protein